MRFIDNDDAKPPAEAEGPHMVIFVPRTFLALGFWPAGQLGRAMTGSIGLWSRDDNIFCIFSHPSHQIEDARVPSGHSILEGVPGSGEINTHNAAESGHAVGGHLKLTCEFLELGLRCRPSPPENEVS